MQNTVNRVFSCLDWIYRSDHQKNNFRFVFYTSKNRLLKKGFFRTKCKFTNHFSVPKSAHPASHGVTLGKDMRFPLCNPLMLEPTSRGKGRCVNNSPNSFLLRANLREQIYIRELMNYLGNITVTE